MNVVIVSEGPCYPATAGNRIRILNLMLRLAGRHHITFLYRSQGDHPEAQECQTYLADHGVTPIVVDDPPPSKKGPLFYVRLAGNLLSTVPYSVTLHNSQRLRQAIRDHAAHEVVDLWQHEWLAYADTLQHVPHTRTVVVAHDVVALLWKRHHEIEANPLKRWYIRRQWRKFEYFERCIFNGATRIVAVSPEDAALVRQIYGMGNKVAVVENGVDNAYYQSVLGTRDPKQILYVGTMESRPNLDAARLLLETIFPVVRARHPGAKLVLVGRRPPDWLVEQVKATPGAELHADAPDVRPFLAASGILAVPLRIAGGSRIKILEALAAGLPVVSTRIGAEGLELTPGEDLVVVERVEDMAEALGQGVANPRALRDMAERGRQVAQDHYDWDALAAKLERVWQTCSELVTG
jgi:glycosyltransferase involved in cell wall biosynthesis